MGIARGSNIITDGLVFGYDTGHNDNITGLDSQPHHNDYRFYRGIPATNVISSGIPGYFGSGGTTLYQKTLNGFSSASGVFQRNYVTNPAQANTGTYNNNAGLYHSGLSFNSLSANTEYVMISFDFYMITPYVRHSASDTGLNGYMRIQYTDGTYSNHGWNDSLAGGAGDDWNNNSAYVGKWRKIALICDVRDDKTPSAINQFYIYNDRTTQGEGIFTNFVITEHTTLPTAPAQWIPQNGSRGNTDCLIDLKRTTSMDVSNVSFDSTGQPTFDGTDDSLTIPGSSYTTSDAKTVEIVFKMNGSYSNYSPLAVYANGSSSTNRIWLGLQNNKFRMHGWGTVDPDGTTTISADEWYVCSFSYDKSTQAMKIYTNGVLESSVTNSQGGVTASSSLNWYLGTIPGGWQGVTYSDVDIPIFKIYNRVLSDSEVKQNYNAIKNRFNL